MTKMIVEFLKRSFEQKKLANFCVLTVLVILFEAFRSGLHAQDIKVVPQTPNAMKLTEYQIQRPLLYTGTASVSIPLYTIDFDGMAIPISISYAATGIRTNEEAGEVGLGWALNATGVISRNVKGGDDLFQGNKKGYVYNAKAVTHDLGYAYNDITVATVPEVIPENSYYWDLVYLDPDTQPDVFSYNFFGSSGSFVLSQKVATNNSIEVIKLTQDAYVITFNEATKTFQIITPSGFKGEFLVKEFSTSFSYGTTDVSISNGNCWNAGDIDIEQSQNDGRFRTITSWYLKQITSPRGEVLNFNYDLNPDGSSSFVSNTRSHIEVEINNTPVVVQTIQEHVYLKEIIGDEVKVEFSMENREDLRINTLYTQGTSPYFPQGAPLKRYNGLSVTGLSPLSTLNKLINFKHGYFNQHHHDQLSGNQSDTELRWLRSRLERVTIDDQEYNFFYEKGLKGLPDKLTRGIDYFGFYNGRDDLIGVFSPRLIFGQDNSCRVEEQNYLNPAYYQQSDARLVNFGYGKAGVLNKVVYPTRGYTILEFEPHVYQADWRGVFRESFLSMSAGVAGGTRIKSIKDYDEVGLLQKSKSYQYIEVADALPNAAVTTGKLMVPLYNRFTQFARNPFNNMVIDRCQYTYTSNSSIPGNNAAEGKAIGYSKVHEFVEGPSRYRTTYYFENIPSDVLDGNAASNSFERVNGHQKEIRDYNSTGQIMHRTQNLDYNHEVGEVKGIAYGGNAFDPGGFAYVAKYTLKQNFTMPYQTITETVDIRNPMVEDATGTITSTGSTISNSVTRTFNNRYLLKTETTTGSVGETIVTEYKRPTDYTTKSSALQHMVSATVNQVENIIESWTRKNGSLIQGQGLRYELDAVNNRINLTAQYGFNPALGGTASSPDGFSFPSPYEWRGTYTYNNTSQSSGKILEYSLSDGTIQSFIWGNGAGGPLTNNGKYLMAHGIGINYSQLSSAYTSAVVSPDFDLAIRDHTLTTGKSITTYTHNPLVGITKMTDAGKKTQTFHYDSFSRLTHVKDQSGNVLATNQYQFKTRQPTRILSLSGDLNFGTMTNDMFAIQFGPYDRCSDPLRQRILTFSNLGDEDLIITSIVPPSGFSLSWLSGTISPGTSVDVIVTFNKFENLPLGNYSGTIQVNSSNMTSGDTSFPVSATYVARTVGLSFAPVTATTPKIFDMGTTTGGIYGVPLQITNTSNGPLRIYGLPLDWDGVSGEYHTFNDPDFSVSYYFTDSQGDEVVYSQCIWPGQAVNVPVTFNPVPGPNGVRSTKLSVITDLPPSYWSYAAFKDVVTIQANIQRPVSAISMDTSPISVGNFTEPSRPVTINIANTGTLGFTVSGLSFSNPAHAQHFTLSPSNFLINPGQSHAFTLTFHPTSLDLNLSATITINNDAMAGNETFSFSGNRYSYRKLEMSTSATNNELWFDNQFQTRTLTITNSTASNDNLSVTGYSPANTSLQHFSVSSFTSGTLTPGQSMNMQVTRTGATPTNNEVITILSNKNDGGNTFTPKGYTRVIALSTVTFASFTGATASQPMTVSNSGTGPLSVTNITSSNSRFTITPTSFTVPAGGSQNVTITYTPTNFTAQSSAITVVSNATSGTTTRSVSAQRTQLTQLTLSPNSLSVRPSNQTPSATLTNTGNMPVTINSPGSNSNSTAFLVTHQTYSVATWITATFPVTLQPGQQLRVVAATAQSGNYSSATGTLTINTTSAGTHVIYLSRSTF